MYDLYFWRQIPKERIETPIQTYNRLNSDEEVEGIIPLRVDQIKEEFTKEFPEIKDGGAYMDWEGVGGAFQIFWPVSTGMGWTLAIQIACTYSLLEENIDVVNRIVGVANRFGCAFYDPQINERFLQPEPVIKPT